MATPERAESDARDSIGGLLKHSSIYAIAPLVQRILALGLIKLYTAELSSAQWGVLGLTDLLLGLLPILVGTSLLAGMSRHYFLQRTPEERNSVITTVLAAVFVTSTAIATLGIVFRYELTGAIFSKVATANLEQYVEFVVLCLLIFPLSLVSTVGIESLQLEKRSKAVVKITIAKTLFEAALKLTFLFGFGMGVQGFLLAVLAGEIVAAVGLVAHMLRRFGTRVSRALVRPLLGYSGPLIPVACFQLGLHQADKLLIERLGPDAVIGHGADGEPLTEAMRWVGTYSFGYQIPFIFHAAVIGSFVRIWLPNMFGTNDTGDRAAHALRVGTLVVSVMALAYAGVALFAREGVHLLAGDPEYHRASSVVPWIAGAYFVYGSYTLAQAALMSVMATRTLAVLNGLALALNLALNVALVPHLGILGAALATLTSFSFLTLGAANAAMRRGIRPYDPRRLLAGGALVALGGVTAYGLDGSFEPWSFGALTAKATSALVLVGVSLALLPRDERRRFLERVRSGPGA